MKKFLKILSIILLILFVLLIIILTVGFIFLKNFDIKKYKPQIIKAASESVGRPVDFKDIDLNVSLEKGVRFHITDVSIAENPDFGSGDFASVEEIDAGVDIMSFVVSRQISVPSILIRSPRIDVIRDEKGLLNVQTIGGPSQNSSQQTQSVSPAAGLPAIFINSVKIENAQINFADRSIQPELKLGVTQLSLDIQHFSLTGPFDYAIDGAVLSTDKNFHLAGRAQLKLLNHEANLSATELAFDVGQLPLAQLKTFPMLAGVPLPQVLEGQINVKIVEAVVSDKGLGKLNANMSLANGKVIAPEIVPGISVEASNVNLSLENLTADGSLPAKIILKAALYQDETNVDLSATAAIDLKTTQIHLTDGQFSTDLALWPFDKIKAAVLPLKDVPLPDQLSGKFQTTIRDAVLSAKGLETILLDAKLDQADIALNHVLPGAAIALNKTDLSISNFSLTDDPFSVSIKTAYLSDTPNIAFDGGVSLDLKTQAATVKDAIATLDLDGFPLEKFKASGLVPTGTPFPQGLTGKMKVKINNLSVSPKGVDQISSDIQWTNGSISIKDVAPGISVTANQINLNINQFSLSEAFAVSGSLGYESDEPNISFDGKVKMDTATQQIKLSDMSVKTDLAQIPFQRLKTSLAPLKDLPLPQILKGQLDMKIKDFSTGPQGLTGLNVDVALKEGEVSMKDVSPGISFAASHLNIGINHFGLDTPFDFNVNLAYLNSMPNIETKGTGVFHMADQTIALNNATTQIDLATLSFDALKSSVASLKDVPLPEKLKGLFRLDIANAVAGPKGLTTLTANGSLKDWEVKMKELIVPISGSKTDFKITENNFSMDDFLSSIGQGKLKAKISVADYLTSQTIDLAGELDGINLVEILDQKDAPVKVEGLMYGKLNVTGTAADLKTLTGNGNFEFKETKLKNLNVLKTVLDKISFLPNVASRVQTNLPEKYQKKLQSKDTEINSINADLVIAGGMATLDPISMEADEFTFSGKCVAGFDQKYALDGNVKIPEELSAAMGAGVEDLRYLYDANNNISMPVHVTGKGAGAPVFAVTQTALEIGKGAVRNEAKKQLGNILDKALGVPEETTDPQNLEPGQEAPQPQKSPSSEIIDGIFDNIFK